MSRSRDLGDVGSKANFLDNVSTDLGDFSGQSIPHIVPRYLHPAIEGKSYAGVDLKSLVTAGSYVWGDVYSGDNRRYFYTDIKGSRPIKDSRVGSHFGAQRYRCTSLQLLEQETALHGYNVYTVDGREYMRACSGTQDWQVTNDASGTHLTLDSASSNAVPEFIEIVAYANMCNFQTLGNYSGSNSFERMDVYVDGTLTFDDPAQSPISVSSPLLSRYLVGGSTRSAISSGVSLGIHTFKFQVAPPHTGSSYMYLSAIELIAQDTTSTANRSKIQIPSQDVVSYGKKFNISGTPHYDPFTTMSYGGSGTTLSNLQSLIDTDTSLGMDAWKAGTSNYHRPWNGGRIIKWVDSSGVIKTSVNMMPPNAQNVGTTASNAVSDAHVIAGTNDDTINFNTSAIDHTQAEVAKTFHFREFGNGNANGGTSGTYKDFSMSSGTGDSVSYVMDDGLTSMITDGFEFNSSENFKLSASGKSFYITFIGTGLTLNVNQNGTLRTVAQNLPYGTHIFKLERYSNYAGTITLDGVVLQSQHANWDRGLVWDNITFHHPKKPSIPEDACVLADYCLLADFVPATSVDGSISKGVRYCNASRDVFYDSGGAITYNAGYPSLGYQFVSMYNNNANIEAKITAFGSAYETHYVRGTNRPTDTQARLDGSNYSYVEADVYDTSGEWDDSNDDGTLTKNGSEAFHMYGIKNQALGVHTFGDKQSSGSTYNAFSAFAVHTPIHTSFHYQTFETPFLHELIGGDRNLEQHTLICTPDGRSWDQITRDTSYLGNLKLRAKVETSWDTASQNIIFDEWRGTTAINGCTLPRFNKDFAIAYDEMICLKDGSYNISVWTYIDNNIVGGSNMVIKINDVNQAYAYANDDPNVGVIHLSITPQLKRGDRIKWHGVMDHAYSNFEITKA